MRQATEKHLSPSLWWGAFRCFGLWLRLVWFLIIGLFLASVRILVVVC